MKALLEMPLVVVTGKGGVGKSTVAAALGVAAARAGKRTIIAEFSSRNDVHRALGGHEAAEVAPLFERELTAGLNHVSIDSESMLVEYLRDRLPGPAGALFARSRTLSSLAAAVPGLPELLSVGAIWDLAQPDRRLPGRHPYDLVIVDAPATGHGLAVLSAPRTFSEIGASGPVGRQAGTIDSLLSDPSQTAIVAACKPEEIIVNETIELDRMLGEQLAPQRLAAIVVNGMYPQRFSHADHEALTAIVAAGSGAAAERDQLTAALTLAQRSASQREQLQRLRRLASGTDTVVGTLPQIVTGEPLGPTDLGRLATEIVR